MKRWLAVSALGYSVVSGIVAVMAVVAVPYIFFQGVRGLHRRLRCWRGYLPGLG